MRFPSALLQSQALSLSQTTALVRKMKTLTADEEDEARKLYEEFWKQYPKQKNPSDINTPEKASYLIQKGFERIRLMQRARKQAYDFTRPEEVEVEHGG